MKRFWTRANRPRSQRNPESRQNRAWRAGGPLDCLEGRVTPVVTATFLPASGTLTILGDNLDNAITVGRNATGAIVVNNGAVATQGGTPTVANTTLLQVFGQGGNDTITLDEANGALPRANLFGGAGADRLSGGSAADMLFGQAGNDVLMGMGGADFLFGGADNDTLVGGDNDDQCLGEAGNDRMIWNPGDDTDLNEGGDGVDMVIVNGGNGAERFAATANGTRVRFDRLDPAPFSIDIGASEQLIVRANGGDDTFSATGNLAALIQLDVDGGTGNDTILGGNGADRLSGGDGNDVVDGNQGNDSVDLGAGDDVFQWDPGDGNDVVEGRAGADRMVFNGANVAELFDVSANGPRVRLTRSVASITMDLDDVETIDLATRGGADVVTVGNMTGTDLATLNVDLASNPGTGAGDGQADTVVVNGTAGNDSIDVLGSDGGVFVLGPPTRVNVLASEGAVDALVVNGLGGDDGISASTLAPGTTMLTLDGGEGRDRIIGSMGADLIIGGGAGDVVDGHQGNDRVFLGEGDDLFQWTPGDGSDVVEGGGGGDRMFFVGSNDSESIDVSANGGRVRFSRDVDNVVMDLDDVETIELRALGGSDTIVVADMTGTDLSRLELDLRGPQGGGDGLADTVVVNGTQNADAIAVGGDAGGVRVSGLPAVVDIFHQEAANDRLTIQGLGGADVIDASSLEADGIALTINGGLGDDTIRGGDGNDLLIGGDGNDNVAGGLGDDVFAWNPGDDSDTLDGQAGFDRMAFNGANIAENIGITAVGGHVRFTRDVANVVMDLDQVEGIDFRALGGADTIDIGDVSGTDLAEINLDLAAPGQPGDGQADTIRIRGTSNDDAVVVAGGADGITVLGLPARVNIVGSEGALDTLRVDTLSGADVVDASGLSAGAIRLVADGGEGDDVLIGSDGDDILIGGEGDDILIGGPGIDLLDGGPGNDIEIQ